MVRKDTRQIERATWFLSLFLRFMQNMKTSNAHISTPGGRILTGPTCVSPLQPVALHLAFNHAVRPKAEPENTENQICFGVA